MKILQWNKKTSNEATINITKSFWRFPWRYNQGSFIGYNLCRINTQSSRNILVKKTKSPWKDCYQTAEPSNVTIQKSSKNTRGGNIFLVIWRFFQQIRTLITDIGEILNDDEFFANTVDPLTEGVEQRRKRHLLKNVIHKVKVVGCKKLMNTGKRW